MTETKSRTARVPNKRMRRAARMRVLERKAKQRARTRLTTGMVRVMWMNQSTGK